MQSLPIEVITNILLYCKTADISAFASASRRSNFLCSEVKKYYTKFKYIQILNNRISKINPIRIIPVLKFYTILKTMIESETNKNSKNTMNLMDLVILFHRMEKSESMPIIKQLKNDFTIFATSGFITMSRMKLESNYHNIDYNTKAYYSENTVQFLKCVSTFKAISLIPDMISSTYRKNYIYIKKIYNIIVELDVIPIY